MTKYSKLIATVQNTPQSKPARPDQVPNDAGGYGFQIDKWQRLHRFLVLGSDSGTYYVNARDLTMQNLDNVKACIAEDGPRVVKLAIDISNAGRAIKNDPAILVMAAALAYGNKDTKQAVRAGIWQVCRTGTHILNFASYSDKLRRWGRSLRSTIAAWYNYFEKLDNLAYQVVKYQSRDGWSHKDLIRLSHVGTNDPLRKALYDWALHGAKPENHYPDIVTAFEAAKTADTANIANMIERYGLSREMIPTERLNDPKVARALALHMPMTAMVRNLGNMSKAGLLTPGDDVYMRILEQLGSIEALKKARIHPITLLIALKTYASGHGVRGSGQWPVVPQVVDALNDAFYRSFDAVEPLGKRLLLALDSSSSMSAEITSTPGFSAVQAGAAMVAITAATEKAYTAWSFDTNVYEWPISPRQRLDDIIRSIPGGGGTDVSAPIIAAIAKHLVVDAIVVYTDEYSWAGANHPFQAIQRYRQKVNAATKLVIVATTANHTTLNAPDDPLSLSIIGFDSTVPDVIRAFLA